jgi:hypothetical protein
MGIERWHHLDPTFFSYCSSGGKNKNNVKMYYVQYVSNDSLHQPPGAGVGRLVLYYVLHRTILLFFCVRARRAQRRPPRRAGRGGGAERCKTRITMYYTYVLHNRCVVIVTWLTCQTLGGTLFVSILTSRTSQNLAHDHAIIPLSLALEDQSSYACIRMHP